MDLMAPRSIRRGTFRRDFSKIPPGVHPGEMLLEEFLKPLGISQVEAAEKLGVSFPRLNEIINGKRSITPDTALRLQRYFPGVSAQFWMNLQSSWDLYAATQDRVAARGRDAVRPHREGRGETAGRARPPRSRAVGS